jgi:hypothetical protein
LQQRSEKRQPMMPARRKMPEVTRNPIAGWLDGSRDALRGRLGFAGSRGGSPGPGGGRGRRTGTGGGGG